MSKDQKIQWPRIIAEGTAVVISILLAFAIDAWWQERREASASREQIRSLLEEFKEAKQHLTVQARWLEGSLEGSIRVLELMGPSASNADLRQAREALKKSFDVAVYLPPQGTLHAVLASRSSTLLLNSDTWVALQDWGISIGDLEVDSRHLESNRDDDFYAALNALSIPMTMIIRAPATEANGENYFGLPESNFEIDASALLRDPNVESVFTARVIRSHLLLLGHSETIELADEIIEQLEGSLL
jgi:hypothetical protein